MQLQSTTMVIYMVSGVVTDVLHVATEVTQKNSNTECFVINRKVQL